MIDIRDVEVNKRVAEAKKQARETTMSNRQIMAKACEGASEEILVQMPTGQSFSRRLRSQRQNHNPNPKAPATLDELVLGDIETNKGEPFLVCDVVSPDGSRIVMFSTPENMTFLGTCDQIHMDGTFSTCPDLFEQVYVIHGEKFV